MGSPFASRRTATIPIQFDPPNDVTLQALAGRHLEKAEIAAQVKWIETMDAKGGIGKQRMIMREFEADKPKEDIKLDPVLELEPEKPADPLAGLDPYTVCRFGIKAWTYDESLEEDATTKRVNALDDMDADSLIWFATQVMRLTKPRLFQTKDERQEAEKNVSAASLTH